MSRGARVTVVSLLAVLVLGWPVASLADHVSISASVTARLAERSGTNSWLVEIGWSIACLGVGASGASYQGNLYLVDVDTGERIYLGGVSGASGTARQIVESRERERRVRPELRISCFENGSLHGSDTIVVTGMAEGGIVIIPARFDTGTGDPPGGRGGGGTGSEDPTEPLRSGGCVNVLRGTIAPDTLTGGGEGDVVFGLGGGDVIHGRGGHDCLLGGTGNDALYGEGGDDRLSGGGGRDRLVGGSGTNAYDAGSGNDYVDARNGRREHVRCGSGRDRARVDRQDRVRSCEVLIRPR